MKNFTRANAILIAATLVLACANPETQASKPNSNNEIPSYGPDLSFPSSGVNAISTNYAWLPHNIDPENNPTPAEFENIPVQVLGDRKKVYDDFMQGCRDYWDRELEDGGKECDRDERDRIYHIKDQPKSMVVSK